MATFTAVCIDGNFEQYATISGDQIRCTGTLVSREYMPSMAELSYENVGEISTAVIGFFAVCFAIRFLVRFVTNSIPSRGG